MRKAEPTETSSPQSKSAVADFDHFIRWPKPAYTRFRLGEGWGEGSCRGAQSSSTPRPPPPTPPQPNLAIARVRPLSKVTEVGSSRLRLGEGRSHLPRPRGADRLDGFARDAGVSLPIAATHTDAADAFALDDHREAAFHGGPPLGAGGERQPDRMGDIERLRLRAPGRGRTLV